MKSIPLKITTFVVLFSLVASNVLLALPQKAQAQAGAASSCTAGYLMALGSSALGWTKEVVGVPTGQGATAPNIVTGGSANALSFNNCILKPLGTAIVIALIRNIGASMVDWINSGFEGRPTFITDFGGTLLNAADQAVGQLIEGSELGFLCNDFSFQIRIALALKYSKPFRQEVTCTLSGIGNNVSNFANNNGGAGWNNFLEITTQPNNNVYGAYLIADSELAQRALTKVDQRYKTISLGSGFDSMTTCDEYETPAEAQTRYLQETSSLNAQPAASTDFSGGLSTDVTSFSDPSASNIGSGLSTNTFNTDTGSVPVTSETFNNSFNSTSVSGSSVKPQCKPGKTFVGTPGATIAHKLDSVLGQGEIQAAVAQEIDQVIAATLNQVAQKALQGVGGLLGSSKKKSTTSSYINNYRKTYYGDTVAAASGPSSAIDSYRVVNYDDVTSLTSGENDVGIAEINKLIETTTNKASASQRQQVEAFVEDFADGTSTVNAALLKPSEISSGSNPAGANNGVTDTSTYYKAAVSDKNDKNNPWWQVDLEKQTEIQDVRIWKVVSNDVTDAQSLGTFRVLTSNDNSKFIEGPWIDSIRTQPVVVPLNRTARYVRVEKKARSYVKKENGENVTYYYPLRLAEVQVVTPVGAARASSTTSTTDVIASSTPGTASIAVQAQTGLIRLKAKTLGEAVVPVTATLGLWADTQTTIPNLEISLLLDGAPVAFRSLIDSPRITVNRGGFYTPYDLGTEQLFVIKKTPVGGTLNSSIILSGNSFLTVKGTTYQLKVEAKDESGAVLSTGTANFVVE